MHFKQRFNPILPALQLCADRRLRILTNLLSLGFPLKNVNLLFSKRQSRRIYTKGIPPEQPLVIPV
jgi:hypothetical protein